MSQAGQLRDIGNTRRTGWKGWGMAANGSRAYLMTMMALCALLITGCPQGIVQPSGDDATDPGAGQTTPGAPTASFVTNFPDAAGSPSSITLDASSSVAGDATIVAYVWDFDDGTDPTVRSSAVVGHVYAAAGTYTVQLTVRDEDDVEDSLTIVIEVPAPLPATPTADIQTSVTAGDPPLTVDFDGAGSDAGFEFAQIVSYEWNFDDGSDVATEASVSHIFEDAGAYRVALTVTNSDGLSATVETIITVNGPATVQPVAAFIVDDKEGAAPLAVAFDASTSTPGGGATIISYTWDFGDGSAAGDGVTTTHTYVDQGSYIAQLTIVDGIGGSDAATLLIQVLPPVGSNDVASISVTPAALQIDVDAIQQLAVEGVRGDGSVVDITADPATSYASSDESVITVSGAGVAIGVANGQANITVTYETLTAEVPVLVGELLVVQIVRDPAEPRALFDGETVTLTASIASGEIDTALWALAVDGVASDALLATPTATATAVSLDTVGEYVAVCLVTDTIGQQGVGTLTFTVSDLTGTLSVNAGNASRVIPNGNDFGGDTPFTRDAILTTGDPDGLVVSLSGIATDPINAAGGFTYKWTPAIVPAPVANNAFSPPDVLILTDTSPDTEFQIRPAPQQIALLDSGLPGTYVDRVVPGVYGFRLTARNSLENVASAIVMRTISPGFEVLGPGGSSDAFEGVTLKPGSIRHRVLPPTAHPLSFVTLTRQSATLAFDLFDDGNRFDENGAHAPSFFSESWCGSAANPCVQTQGSFSLVPGTAQTPILPPAIEEKVVNVTAGSRGTYHVRARVTDGAWVDTPNAEREPEMTGAVVHVQDALPGVLAVSASFEDTSFAHIGLVNSVTAADSTTVDPVAIHGARTNGIATRWKGDKVISTDLDRDAFPEVIIVKSDRISMFSGLSRSPYDMTGTLAAPTAVGTTTLILTSAVTVAKGDQLTLDVDNGDTEVVEVTEDATAATEITVSAVTHLHPVGAVVQGYLTGAADPASPIDNSKNNTGTLAHDPTTLLSGDDTITDACFGDVNGDGFTDMIVGRGSFGTGQRGAEGRVDVFLHDGDLTFGHAPYGATPDIQLTRPSSESWKEVDGGRGGDRDLFGYSVACGNITGDVTDDILVGAPLAEHAGGVTTTITDVDQPNDILFVDSATGLNVGDRIILNRGESNARITRIEAIALEVAPGVDRLTTSGFDADQAAVDDTVQRFEATGALYSFAGDVTWTVGAGLNVIVEDDGTGATFRMIPIGSDDGDLVGTAVAVDSGLIVFGAPGRTNAASQAGAGAIFTFSGSPDLSSDTGVVLVEATASSFEGDAIGLALGRRVSLGHVTGAVQSDIVVSAANNTEVETQGQSTAQGAVYLIPAGTASQTAIATLPHMVGADVAGGGARNHNLGATIAVGEFNGDGFDDILLTAPSVSSVNHRVFVVFGQANMPLALPFDLTLLHHTNVAFLESAAAVGGATGQTAILYRSGGAGFVDANGDRVRDLLFSGVAGFEATMIAGSE